MPGGRQRGDHGRRGDGDRRPGRGPGGTPGVVEEHQGEQPRHLGVVDLSGELPGEADGLGYEVDVAGVALVEDQVEDAQHGGDVTVPVEAKKFHANDNGEEKEAPLSDLIELGLFTAEPGGGVFDKKDVLHMERQKVRSGKQLFHFVTDEKPTHSGIDPYNFYIDRNSGDNVGPVTN